MPTTHALTVTVVGCGALALVASIWLAVTPHRIGRRSLRLPPLAWQLARVGLVATLSTLAAGCALAAVGLLGPGAPR
ncbi:hypothetical protein SAMN04488570_1835 [Nocardioides scoriae]|uniref:Uncharacterized protein n=1 Tax=Nocardioides scoriae TaxID=642780 RepID=A0A1H1S1L5_9ACTN|nr:hypothetical protein [Nocardioides scoriae]SDS41783.1 hypothetical protein SAMN04488570_1835 [Nocardioides scoriae]